MISNTIKRPPPVDIDDGDLSSLALLNLAWVRLLSTTLDLRDSASFVIMKRVFYT